MNLASYIDHTLLDPRASQSDIVGLCEEALQHHFYAVCVQGSHLAFAKAHIQKTEVQLATVVGFPLGVTTTATKVFETQKAISLGADEIDMVLHIGALIEGDLSTLQREILEVRKAAEGKVLKVILENCYLTDEQKRQACLICLDSGVDYIKTSTGFGPSGATLHDVQLMKATVGNIIKIKASGGIKDAATALQFITHGADRIGTSSGVSIVTST